MPKNNFPVPSRLTFDVCAASRSSAPSEALRRSLALLGGHVHCLHMSARTPLADARMELIDRVDTDWFLFLDDDVRLSEAWLGALAPFLGRPDVGAVYGVIPVRGYGRSVDAARVGVVNQLAAFALKPEERGDTLDTFIRTAAIKDWVPILAVRCGEDAEISRHARAKGFLWMCVPVADSFHIRGWCKAAVNAFCYGRNFTGGNRVDEFARCLGRMTRFALSPKVYPKYGLSEKVGMPLSLRIHKIVVYAYYLAGLILWRPELRPKNAQSASSR